MPTLDLNYESKWWLLLPRAFPNETDATALAWAERIVPGYSAASPWDESPYKEQLPAFLADQYRSMGDPRTASLWYCPFGLPAVGYVQITLTRQPEGSDVTVATLTAGLHSRIDFELIPVETANLGEGVGFSRLRSGTTTDDGATLPSYAETNYLFLTGSSLVEITARSADPAVIGLMGEELWNLVESISIND